ncbi:MULTISPECIES: pyrimidine dimer DNA glycosylase/endonuclease V [Solibacillus]|uniref:Neutral trehalase n=1 Tax=Solibacillus merdavium TaxID=2762218 RepID=A0ABR8XS12_9BACL|nr:pyrimidine dimer DNA glycosylase/endonuclease V [Solibacillus merdavium]MBD8034722.1 neutral trehalase [Solibacillus merdavium]
MRLWHTELIPFIPKSQLLAQWRELNSIFAKEDRHILINYVYDYPKEDLYIYTQIVLKEMLVRNITIRTIDKMERYFTDITIPPNYTPFKDHHNDEYLTICYYNLYEKYIRGQKDFSKEQFDALQLYFYSQKRDSK